MRRTPLCSLALLAPLVLAPTAGAQRTAARAALGPAAAAAAAAAPAAPAVGELAPDFSAAWADSAGVRAEPVTLKALRGKVVVLAFYPKDRSSGCTAELTKFRDEHDTLFGANVVVLPISVDSVAAHASWAREMRLPFALVADPSLAVAQAYGSRMAERPLARRAVFVVGKDGRIAWRDLKFNALSEDAYAQLAAEVAKAR
jgi:peroxiredoxin Q/BCP